MAESLAVRYRPRRFADVAGQSHVCAVLLSAASRQSPPQQILLSGPSGLGKTTTARIFASALFCEHRAVDGDACGSCGSCVETAEGRHPDVIELDAASNGGKDEVRELASRAVLAPLRARWKVYIVDEAHGLTGPGGQAFLKLLEEPPSHCIFILATTDPGKLPAAVRGRCVELDVLPATTSQQRSNLARICAAEEWEVSPDVLDAVLDASDVALGLRGTVMTLEKLAGPLSSGEELTSDDVEALLGVLSPRRLEPLTAAIVAGDRTGTLLALEELQGRPGASRVRQQVISWARRRLLEAARARSGVEQALHVYETLVEAPAYVGAFEVALARAAAPHMADSPQAVRALLEQARGVLEQIASVRPAGTTIISEAPSAVAAPDATTPGGAGATSSLDVRASVPPSSASAVEAVATIHAEAPVAPAPAPSAPESAPLAPPSAPNAAPVASVVGAVELDVQDTRLRDLLNFVSKAAPRAGLVLRRSQVLAVGDALLVRVPDDQRERAQDLGLAQVLHSAPFEVRLEQG